MAHVTDYDVWHETEEVVTAEKVIQILAGNLAIAQAAIAIAAREKHHWEGEFAAHNSMKGALALISDWGKVPPETREKLLPIIGSYMESGS